MPEQVQKILDRIVGWWKKYNTKQKALWISILAVMLIALGILGYVVSRPSLVAIYTASDMSEAASISELLREAGIEYTTESGGRTFMVDVKDEVSASYLLAQNSYPSLPYDIKNVVTGSFSTTESDKQKLYVDHLEKKFAHALAQQNGIESAQVSITLPKDDGTILSGDDQGTAAVSLVLRSSLSEEQAYGIALFIATELGNDDTKGITIIDQNNNIVFSGSDSNTVSSVISSQLTNTQKRTEMVENQVRKVLSSTYSNLDVSASLDINYSQTKTTKHEFYPPDGMTNGMIGSQSTYDAEARNYDGDIPGTDTNSDTTQYMIDDDGYGYWTVSDVDTQYQNNELLEESLTDGGTLIAKNSSISVIGTRFVTYTEAQLRAKGLLEDVTYEEYQELNSEPYEETVDASFVEVIANATGIPVANISFKSYVKPIYQVEEQPTRSVSDILQIVLAVLIFALLGYVVFRSTRRTMEPEMEPELSVETLLEATQENNEEEMLENIGYSEKSETRLLIEKFVDENPDAAALLLRNWLNDDWE